MLLMPVLMPHIFSACLKIKRCLDTLSPIEMQFDLKEYSEDILLPRTFTGYLHLVYS